MVRLAQMPQPPHIPNWEQVEAWLDQTMLTMWGPAFSLRSWTGPDNDNDGSEPVSSGEDNCGTEG